MKKGMIFVETRQTCDVPSQLEAFEAHLKYLPDDFDVLVFASEQNKHIYSNYNVQIIDPIHTKSEYDYLLTNPDFWRLLPFDFVLVTQHDSALLKPGLERFYDWDYVGAPWKFQQHGGNGGLSWRNTEAMHQLSTFHYSPQLGHEDVFFCNLMNKHKQYNMAPRTVCEQFSTEAVFKLGTLGYHNIDRWLTPEECKLIRNQYGYNRIQ